MPAEEVYRRTGIQFMDFNSLFQLDTIKRNGGSALEAADKVLFVPDALIYMLTGKAVCEYTVASTSQLLNPVTGDIDEDILVWDMDGTFDKENVWVDTWESPDVCVYELESGMDLEGLAWMSLPKPSKEKLEHENNR